MVAIKEVNENELSETGSSPSACPPPCPAPHVSFLVQLCVFSLLFLLLTRPEASPG